MENFFLPRIIRQNSFEKDNAGLLVIDMQFFSAHPCYSWGLFLKKNYPEAHEYYFSRIEDVLIPNINKLIGYFKETGLTVIFITVGSFSEKGDFLRNDDNEIPPMVSQGTFEHRIIDGLFFDKRRDISLNKNSRSPFNSTGLDLFLKKKGLKNLFLTGVHTSSCIDLTAKYAVDLGYNAIIVEDGTATFSEKLHEATLETYSVFFGEVMDSNEILKAF